MIATHSQGITLSEAANLLPKRRGRKRSISTLKRWIAKGCRGVRLYAWRSGNEWFTTPEALAQFERECTARSEVTIIRPRIEQARAIIEARELLRRNGFYGKDREIRAGSQVPGGL